MRELNEPRIILLERIELNLQTCALALQTRLLLVQGDDLLIDGVDEFLSRTDILPDKVQFVLRRFLVLLGLLEHLAGSLKLLGVLLLLRLKLLERLTVDACCSKHQCQ